MKQASKHASAPKWPPVERRLRTSIRNKLLRWYDRNQRDLPWRHRCGDPYAQWVAEIMLQQTRVETVLSYYEPFLRRFPTVEALARATDDRVLKCWEGLGYYRRVLNLRDAARILRKEGGPIPSTARDLRRLPGIGEYTSAAIASIAFGERAAAVDGNVARVLARLFGVAEDVRSSCGKRWIQAIASELIPNKRPGDFNQAWMDLGSAVCTPAQPECPICPLRRDCVAAATGRVASLPNRGDGRNEDVPQVTILVGVFRHEQRLLVRRRPVGGLWSGLWEFPNTQSSTITAKRKRATSQQAQGVAFPSRSIGRVLRQLAGDVGVHIQARYRDAGTVRHRLTHRALTFRVFVADVTPSNGVTSGRSLRWVSERGFQTLCVSTAHRRIHAAAKNDGAVTESADAGRSRRDRGL